MNDSQKQFLLEKLSKLNFTVEEKEKEKKDLVAGFNRTLKTYKQRISAFSSAIETGDDEYVENIMHESEYSEYLDIK